MQYVKQVEDAINKMLKVFQDPDVVKVQNFGRKKGYITAKQASFVGSQYNLLFPKDSWNSWWEHPTY